jgi:hypothetical protein
MEPIQVSHEISKARIGCLLCSAFEFGSGYWCSIDRDACVEPPEVDFEAFKGDSILEGPDVYYHIHWPLSDGGSLALYDAEEGPEKGDRWTLDLEACRRGLQVMAVKYPRHFANFMRENDDSETGDVYLQCCLLGELVFG